MAVIRPFKALRPVPEKAHLVSSVPYDVVNRDEAKELVYPPEVHKAGNGLSFLKITRSEIDLDDNVNPYSSEVYLKAKENLEALKQNAPLITDDKPHFYLYRLIMNGRAQVGICATFSVDDYNNNIILKHEKTRKEKEDDRTNHILTTDAQTGVVFLTYRGVDAINKIVDKTIYEEKPVYDFTSPDGIKHTVWIIPDRNNDLIVNEIAKVKNLYIADGHHRAASASRARAEKKNANPSHTGNEEYNFFIAVLFPAEQLRILPYNRIVKDLNGKSSDEFLNKVSEKFIIEKTDMKEPAAKRNFAMYLGGLTRQSSDAVPNFNKGGNIGGPARRSSPVNQNFNEGENAGGPARRSSLVDQNFNERENADGLVRRSSLIDQNFSEGENEGGKWYSLKPKDSISASLSLSKSHGDALDVSILQDFLLNPVLNLDDPRTNKRIDFVGGIRGTKELERLVDSGKAAVAFSLYPVSVEELMSISDAGEIMPPKSTWFEPKLRDGLIVHLI